MISKLIEAIYTKVFVNIIVNRSSTNVYIEVCSRNNVDQSDEKEFESISMNEKMHDFIYSYTQDTPYFYISILDTSQSQGAIPTCEKSQMSKFYDADTSTYICNSNNWAHYSSKYDLELLKNSYKDVGIDFIFSSFSVLSSFFKDKIDSTMAMYILVEDNYISLSVFDNSKLLFAKHLDMEYEDESSLLIDEEEEDEEDFDLGESVNLDDLDVDDDMDSLDDLGDIEDLGNIEEMTDFEEEGEISDISSEEDDTSSLETEGFNEDYQRYSLIQNAINTFYKDPKYESKFIETVYIADSIGVSSDLKTYLEEDMFLSVYIRQLDLSSEICELAKEEV